MQIPGSQPRLMRVALVALTLLSAALLPAAEAHAAATPEPSPLHWSAKKIGWDRKRDRVDLEGDAAVHQTGETIRANHILLDLANRTLEAQGNCIYIAAESVIYGEEMHFNLETRTGTIMGGRVANERFTLTGQRLNKLGEGRYQTHKGSYTTCLDCPSMWTLSGDDVDLEFEGYAYMSNVSAKLKDAPVFWLPYLVVPLKTRRQSGLLFPRLGFTNEGLTYVLPFFWAISRSADMTFGAGEYSGRGLRMEWEGRYRLSDRSAGQGNFYLLRDKTFETYLASRGLESTSTRWAIDIAQSQELPFGLEEKLRFTEMSDNLYPSRVGDIPGSGGATVTSEVFVSGATENLSAYVAGRRYRNLISLDPDPRIFDTNTVQVFPKAVASSNDRFLFGTPVAVGLKLESSNFTRTTESFDRDLFIPGGAEPRPGVDPIRKATRFTGTPSIYTTLRPWDLFSVVPSLEYRAYFYSFHNDLPNLTRGYPLFQTTFQAQLEKVYSTDDPDIPKVKNLIRPSLTYSRIPIVHEDPTHPFLRQVDYAQANGFAGYGFDNQDIVPLETNRNYNNYFTPLGNSVSLGLTTQWIRRRGRLTDPAPGYQRMVELTASQTVDFQELRLDPETRQPLSRFNATGLLELDRYGLGVDYYYYPYATLDGTTSRSVVSGSFTYVLDRTLHQRILAFERSLSLGYTYNRLQSSSQTDNVRLGMVYSLSDYWLPSFSISYDVVSSKLLRLDMSMKFQHWSQCVRAEIRGSIYSCDKIRPEDTGVCNSFGLDLTLNLTGAGFGGISEVASTVVK